MTSLRRKDCAWEGGRGKFEIFHLVFSLGTIVTSVICRFRQLGQSMKSGVKAKPCVGLTRPALPIACISVVVVKMFERKHVLYNYVVGGREMPIFVNQPPAMLDQDSDANTLSLTSRLEYVSSLPARAIMFVNNLTRSEPKINAMCN